MPKTCNVWEALLHPLGLKDFSCGEQGESTDSRNEFRAWGQKGVHRGRGSLHV